MSKQMSVPQSDRPIIPDGYGVPETAKGLLPWSHVEERLVAARNYWINTANTAGRPHATPVWGVWVNGALYFDGSPETRRSRDIAVNPAVAVHLESGDDVVILEGTARDIGAPPRELAEAVSAAYCAKYAARGYAPTPEAWNEGGLCEMRPQVAFAWTQFPQNVTRWRF